MSTREHKELTDKELMQADVANLTDEQIQRKINIINLRKIERELKLTEFQNEKFEDDQETRARMARAKTENIRAEKERIEREQETCKHKTGGMDKPGFFNGDGERYGTCTSIQRLPTGEVYVLCFRCQKEWHSPDWPAGAGQPSIKRQVIEGQATLAQYYRAAREYNAVLEWPRKSFSPVQGEMCAASQFNIPKLKTEMNNDTHDFGVYLSRLDKTVIALAQQGIESQELAVK